MAGRERWSDGLLESGFGSPAAARLLSWDARIRAMLRVESALAAAQAQVGLIPADAAAAVAAACDPDALDIERLARDAAAAATPVIPLLHQLRAVAPDVSEHLHLGATSQDIVDTAMVRQLRAATELLAGRLLELGDRLAQLAHRHRDTVAAGRTLGQQAVPITFGLRAARWLGAVDRRVEHLRDVAVRVLVAQLGGAAGTLGSYGEHGPALLGAFAAEVGLAEPDLPWHAERDRIVEYSGALAAVVATVGTIAADLIGLAQTEIGEVRESASLGTGSTAMPQKRNPVHATAARAAARLAQGEIAVLLAADEHAYERAAGTWQAEWVALPSAVVRTVGAVERLRDAVDGLEVDVARCRDNLAVGLGITGSEALAAALSAALGRAEATAVVGELAARASAERRPLAEVAEADERVRAGLGDRDVVEVLAPEATLASVGALIERALATHARLGGRGVP